MSNLIENLKAHGTDISGAMERFLDDEELYIDCLIQFMEDLSFDALKHAIDEKDYESAFSHAHSLKGVAGNLGLMPLYHAIGDIVSELRAKRYDNMETLFRDVIAYRDLFNTVLK